MLHVICNTLVAVSKADSSKNDCWFRDDIRKLFQEIPPKIKFRNLFNNAHLYRSMNYIWKRSYYTYDRHYITETSILKFL